MLSLLLVTAFVGLVTSQQQQGVNFPDAARFPGGSSQSKFTVPPPNAVNPGSVQGNVHHSNVGAAPVGGSSRQQVPDLVPVQPGPVQGVVNHANAGAAPAGGSSKGLTEPPPVAPLGPIVDRVNMVNAGANPVGGNQNSNEVFYGDYGGGAAANNAPAAAGTGGGSSTGGGNNQVQYNAAGGSSRGAGNSGPAYGVGPYSDNSGKGAPLGGAAINDLTQQEAGKAEHVSSAASVGATVGGVVIAVLVLVGIVGVAAVFLVRQRQSRMTIASV